MKILVVGAGIAGSASALHLTRTGHTVELVDASPTIPRSGYILGLDATARRLFTELGAMDRLAPLTMPCPPLNIRHGARLLTRVKADDFHLARRDTLTAEFADFAAQTVPIQFGKRLAGIEHRLDSVIAHFEDGTRGDYDLIIGADGLNSTVRRLAIENGRGGLYRNNNVCLWANVPNVPGAPVTASALSSKAGDAQVFPYPDREESLVVAVLPTPSGGVHPSAEQLLTLTQQVVEGAGSGYASIAQALRQVNPEDVHTTAFTQVRLPRWHARRVILVGDAAHCIDPLSGMGAHAALLGAKILAEELNRRPGNLDAAASRYKQRTQRFVRAAQLGTAGFLEMTTARTLPQGLKGLGQLAGSLASLRFKSPA